MCYWLDNLSDKEMTVILKERNRRSRSKNLYPDKNPKSQASETSLIFAINPK
jgi:hypothetical protein